MGQIVAGYDLMPEGTDVDLQAIIDKLPTLIPAGIQITETSINPVAFGLMKITAGFVVDDADSEIGSKLEDALRAIPGIAEIECVASTVL
ncbi:MAG: translation elongation factor EF-1beta [Candidatus Methanomethylophilaceae archaeon]|nr:translation elongation factor EF-1beta [Candidatus Methanomethylophilaceae archaeon]